MINLILAVPLSFATNRTFSPQTSCGGIPCIPGFDKFALGFDALIGDLPRQPLPLLNYSFASKATYTNPFDKSLVYGVPDQINVIDDTHAEQSVSTSTFHSTTSYSDHISAKAHLSAGFGWFSASASASYSRTVLKDTDDYGAFSSSSLRVNLYDMVVVPSSYMLSGEARDFLAQLPDDFGVDDYLPFIYRYGTHYVAAAKLGGSGKMTSAVNKAFSSSSDDTKVSAQASVHFSFLQAGGSAQSQVKDASSDFTSSSSFQAVLEGGDPRLGLTDWKAWIKTFYQAPAMIEYTLREVTELLPAEKKSNVATIVDQYRQGVATQSAVVAGFKNTSWFNTAFARGPADFNNRPYFCHDAGWGDSNLYLVYIKLYNTWMLVNGAHQVSPRIKGSCSDSFGGVTGDGGYYALLSQSDPHSNAYHPCGKSDWEDGYHGWSHQQVDVACSFE